MIAKYIRSLARIAWLIGFVAVTLSAQNCPSWSPFFDQMETATGRQSVTQFRQSVSQMGSVQAFMQEAIRQAGGPSQAIAAAQQMVDSATQQLAEAEQWFKTNGAAAASVDGGRYQKDEVPLRRDFVRMNQGTADLLRCYAGQSGGSRSGPKSGGVAPGAGIVGVLGQLGMKSSASGPLNGQVGFDRAESAVSKMHLPGDDSNDDSLRIKDSTRTMVRADDLAATLDTAEKKAPSDADNKQSDKNNSDDLDMLDSSNHLKPQFVGSTSGSSGRTAFVSGGVANGQSARGSSDAQSDQSNCPASVDAVLNGADPYVGGAMLHFSIKIGSGMRPATEIGGAVLPASSVVQYSIETTVQSASGNVGPTQQEFQTPVAAGQAETTVDVPVYGTAEARDKLLGWRVVAVKCLSSADGTSSTSNVNCAGLIDYRDHQLADQQLLLIKKYGIYAQGKSMIGDIRQQLIDDLKAGVGQHQPLLIKVKTVADLITGIYSILVPEGGAVQTAAHLTADKVYHMIGDLKDDASVIQSATQGDLAATVATLAPNVNPLVAAGKTLYDLAENMKTLSEQRELQDTFETQLDQMDSKMAAYDDAMQKVFAQSNTLDEVRKGITMACTANGWRP